MGYLPEALRNYLLRLGWGHGDDEIIPTARAIEWFDLSALGRAPARFDFAKLDNLNAHYLRATDDATLSLMVAPRLEVATGSPIDGRKRDILTAAMRGLKPRAKTLNELAEIAHFYVAPRPIPLDDKARALITEAKPLLSALCTALNGVTWVEESLEKAVRTFAETNGMKLGATAQPLRAALTGSAASPPIFAVMAVLGREESLGRLADASAG
jgi:glutamyl-tRNA synthetase